MSLFGWWDSDETAETGALATTTKPILSGTPTKQTDQKEESSGFFGWLDDLGKTADDIAGRAVDVVADNWINNLSDQNNDAVKTPDTTPQPSDAKLPVSTNFFDENKTLIMYGGGALVGLIGLIYVMKS